LNHNLQSLANRIQTLLRIDPSLNNSNVKWRAILQTDCNTGNEAEKMFHGIIIHYKLGESKVNISPNPSKDKEVPVVINELIDSIYPKEKELRYYDTNWNEYFDSMDENNINSPSPQRPRNKTKKRRKKSSCPDFKQKKRWFR